MQAFPVSLHDGAASGRLSLHPFGPSDLMDAGGIIGTALIALGIGALIVLRLNRDERDEFSDGFGDVPAIHGELRAAIRKTGGMVASNDGAVTDDALAHRGEG